MRLFSDIPAVKHFTTACCVFFLFVFSRHVSAQDDQPKPPQMTIREIRIAGLENRPAIMVKGMMRSKENGPLYPQVLEEDLKRLFASGHFEDVTVKVDRVPDTTEVIINLTVKENSIVNKIDFTGVNEFPMDEVRKSILSREDKPLTFYNRKMDELSLSDMYLRKGYYFVNVTSEIKADPENGLVLYYNVREGPKVYIDNITFTGNLQKDASDLLKNTYSQPAGFWKFLSATPFIYNDLQNDLIAVANTYRDGGWLDASANIEDIHFSESKEWVDITIHVDEGDKYEINEVVISGNTIFSTEHIKEKMITLPSTTYDQTKINDDVLMIKRMYGEQAYITTDIQTRPSYLTEPGKINVVFAVKEGPQILLNKLNITGNTKTKDKVIRREFTFNPGDPIKLEDWLKSYDRLASKRYFDVSQLQFKIEEPEEKDSDKRDITVEVSEIRTGQVNFGASLFSNIGLAGRLEIVQRNFDIAKWPTSFSDFAEGNVLSGAGQTARISLSPGSRWNTYTIEFMEPYLFDYPVALKTSVYSVLRNRYSYSERRIGGQIALEKRFGRVMEIGMGLKSENVTIFNTDSEDAEDILAMKGTNDLNVLFPYMNIDRRNNSLLPSRGFKTSLTAEYGGHFLGGDFDFLKASILHQHYFQLYTTRSEAKHILQAELRMGWAEPLGDSESLPLYERFYAGGTNSLRGFSFRTVSPRSKNDPVGGNAMVTFSVEYSYPIYRERIAMGTTDIIRGAVFVDSGNVTEDYGDMNMNDFRMAWGLGIRFTIPNLTEIPLSMDFVFPVKKQDDDDTERFHFSLGFFY